MGHGHTHSQGPQKERSGEEIAAGRRAHTLLLAILLPLVGLTLTAMVLMWPSGSKEGISFANPYAGALGVSFESGKIQSVVQEPCTQGSGPGQGTQCTFASTEPDKGGIPVKVAINPDVILSRGVKPGDNIRYLDLSATQDSRAGAPAYIFVDFVRTVPMVLLAVLYAFVVVAVARWRGFRALFGLVGGCTILMMFVLPALVEGKPPLLVALVGSTVIMIGMLYFSHGFSARTSTALLGTMFGLGITAALAAWSTDTANLVGVGNFEATTLAGMSANISVSGIILCGLVISGLGVLNDVTITQASAVWELHELAPDITARKLFASAMRIGRDHIASTVYTIAFAYAGAALPILIVVMLYDRPLAQSLTSSDLAEEVVRTLVGSIGLVLAIPVTSLIAVLVVKATATKPKVRPSHHEVELATSAPGTRRSVRAEETAKAARRPGRS